MLLITWDCPIEKWVLWTQSWSQNPPRETSCGWLYYSAVRIQCKRTGGGCCAGNDRTDMCGLRRSSTGKRMDSFLLFRVLQQPMGQQEVCKKPISSQHTLDARLPRMQRRVWRTVFYRPQGHSRQPVFHKPFAGIWRYLIRLGEDFSLTDFASTGQSPKEGQNHENNCLYFSHKALTSMTRCGIYKNTDNTSVNFSLMDQGGYLLPWSNFFALSSDNFHTLHHSTKIIFNLL